MPSPDRPPQAEEKEENDLLQEWPSSPRTPTHHDQRAFDQRYIFETEPTYLPSPHDHHSRTTQRAGDVSPDSTSLLSFRRPRPVEAYDYGGGGGSSTLRAKPSEAGNERSFEMQDLGHHLVQPASSSDGGSRRRRESVLCQDDVSPGEVTPYLDLRARLTQVPINRWTILLLLVLARIVILFRRLDADLADAKSDAFSACNKVSRDARRPSYTRRACSRWPFKLNQAVH